MLGIKSGPSTLKNNQIKPKFSRAIHSNNFEPNFERTVPKFMADVVERTHGKSQAFSSLLVACRKAINEDVSIGILGQVFPEVKTAFEKQISALQDEVGNLQTCLVKVRDQRIILCIFGRD